MTTIDTKPPPMDRAELEQLWRRLAAAVRPHDTPSMLRVEIGMRDLRELVALAEIGRRTRDLEVRFVELFPPPDDVPCVPFVMSLEQVARVVAVLGGGKVRP